MSIKIMTQVERLNKSNFLKLSGPTKFVLFILAKLADNNGTKIYPSHQTIADRTGYCVRTVQVHLRHLEAAGLITIKHHFIHGYQTSNTYTINIDNLQAILDMQARTLSKETVDKSVDNLVDNSETRMVIRGAAGIDKSSDHDLYNINNTVSISERKMFYAELLAKRIYESEVVKLIKRYGLPKIMQVKRKIEELIKKGKIIVRNFGAYLRKALMNEGNVGLKPLQMAMTQRFNIPKPSHPGQDKRTTPQDFKDLGSMLKNMLPNPDLLRTT